MLDMNWSPEPWRISDDGQYVEFADDKYGFYVDKVGGRNAKRIIACVNALRGVENPELFMANIKAIIQGYRDSNLRYGLASETANSLR